MAAAADGVVSRPDVGASDNGQVGREPWRASIVNLRRGANRLPARLGAALSGSAGDAGIYAISAIFAAVTIVVSKYADYRDWGMIASGAYGAASLASLGVHLWSRARTRGAGSPASWSRRKTARWRAGTLAFTLVGALVLPLALEVTWTAAGVPGRHAQPEVAVVEKAAYRLTRGEDPYRTSGPVPGACATCVKAGAGGHVPVVARRDGKVLAAGARVPATAGPPAGAGSYKKIFPYLPGMMSFGLLASVHGIGGAGDARIGFAALTLAVVVTALAFWRRWSEPEWRVLQVMTALPTAALALATGGDDIPVLALMLLGAILLARRRPVWAGCALAAAASLKLTAWPMAVLAVFVAYDRRGRRAGGRIVAVMAGILAPVVLSGVAQGPAAFLDDVVRFPLGLAGIATPAASPLPGHLIVSAAPDWKHVFMLVVVFVATAGFAVSVHRHPPRSAADVTRLLGWLSLFAISFAPATRFGYLIYPVNFFVWSWMLGDGASVPPAEMTAGAGQPAASHREVKLEEVEQHLGAARTPV